MITFTHPAILILALPLFAAWVAWKQPATALNWLRLTGFALVLLALAGLGIVRQKPGGTLVLLADRSASMPTDAGDRIREAASLIRRQQPPHTRFGVVLFGAGAAVDKMPDEEGRNLLETAVNSGASDLALGLQTALSLVPDGEPGRILIMSDGVWTGNDPAQAAARAIASGVCLDYRHLARPVANDLFIERVQAPQQVVQGQAFSISAWVAAPEAQPVEFSLRRGDTVISQGRLELVKGRNRLTFRDAPPGAGAAAYTLEVAGASPDAWPENNQARFIVGLQGELSVLLASGGGGGRFAELLRGAGLKIEARRPQDLPSGLVGLAPHRAVILENVPVDSIGNGRLGLLADWVRSTGGGLMLTGGRAAYAAGGYYGSAIAPQLPLSLEMRKEHRKVRLSVVVALDRSGSMAMPVAGGKKKMDLANLGTAQVLDLLSDFDEFGVLAVDSSVHLIVDLAPVSQARGERGKILKIESMGGGIYAYEALSAAAKMLLKSENGTRHIILFSDAADTEQPGQYRELLAKCRGANITCSVIALGKETDSDAQLCRDIAAAGGGNIYFTEDAHEIPRLFAQDTFTVARSSFMDEPADFVFTPTAAGLGGAAYADPPAVGGYNLCHAREGALVDALTRGEFELPLIARWQAGQGRVLCYTGEVDGKFTGPVAGWPRFPHLLADMASWTAGGNQGLPPGMAMRRDVSAGNLRLRLYFDPENPLHAALARNRTEATFLVEDGGARSSTTLAMRRTQPDTLEATLPLAGGQVAMAAVKIGDLPPAFAPPACLPCSPEHVSSTAGSGRRSLAQLAEISGGAERIELGRIWEEMPDNRRELPLRPWLAALAVLVLLVEIAERRMQFIRGLLKPFARATGRSDPEAAATTREPAAEPPAAGVSLLAARLAARLRGQKRNAPTPPAGATPAPPDQGTTPAQAAAPEPGPETGAGTAPRPALDDALEKARRRSSGRLGRG